MTFDEAIKEIDSALDLIDYEDMPNKIYEVFNKLRKEYAPTVEMTPRAYKFLKEEHNKFIKAGNDNFLSNNGLGNWRFYDEHKIDFDTDEEYIDQFTAEHNHFKGLTRTEVIQAWLHPETIKIIDE